MNRYTWRLGLLEAAFLFAAAIYVIPLVGLINVAFKTEGNNSMALEFEGPYTLANFGTAWVEGKLGAALVNSAVISLISVTLTVLFAAGASYVLARSAGWWAKALFYVFLIGIVVPGQLGLIPLYKTMVSTGTVGTIWPVILLHTGSCLAFSVFLITTFVRDLPLDYEEAAMIDGASSFGIFIRIVLPLLRPVIGTACILNGIATWNSFFIPLLYLAGTGLETVPVRLYGFVGLHSSQWEVIFAGLLITILPILAAFFFLQRSVMSGFAGGVKG